MGEIPGSFSTCGGVNESAFVFLGCPAWQVVLLVIPGKCCGSACLKPASSFCLSTSVPCGSSSCSLLQGLCASGLLVTTSFGLSGFVFVFVSSGRIEGSGGIKSTDEICRQTSESCKLSRVDLFAFSPSPCLVLQREEELSEAARRPWKDAATLLEKPPLLFVLLWPTFLDACWGLRRSRYPPFLFLLFLLKPFTQMEMNCVLTLSYRDLCKWIVKWSHGNSLDTCCVLCWMDAVYPLTDEQMNIHMTWKVSASLGDALAV